jgi:hypothetical protein
VQLISAQDQAQPHSEHGVNAAPVLSRSASQFNTLTGSTDASELQFHEKAFQSGVPDVDKADNHWLAL